MWVLIETLYGQVYDVHLFRREHDMLVFKDNWNNYKSDLGHNLSVRFEEINE